MGWHVCVSQDCVTLLVNDDFLGLHMYSPKTCLYIHQCIYQRHDYTLLYAPKTCLYIHQCIYQRHDYTLLYAPKAQLYSNIHSKDMAIYSVFSTDQTSAADQDKLHLLYKYKTAISAEILLNQQIQLRKLKECQCLCISNSRTSEI